MDMEERQTSRQRQQFSRSGFLARTITCRRGGCLSIPIHRFMLLIINDKVPRGCQPHGYPGTVSEETLNFGLSGCLPVSGTYLPSQSREGRLNQSRTVSSLLGNTAMALQTARSCLDPMFRPTKKLPTSFVSLLSLQLTGPGLLPRPATPACYNATTRPRECREPHARGTRSPRFASG